MEKTIDDDLLNVFWECLNSTERKSKTFDCEKIFKEVLSTNWVYFYQLEDILYLLDNRLYLLSTGDNYNKVFDYFDIHIEYMYGKPKSEENETFSIPAISVENLAMFLILLERIGFYTDATYLVDKLLPSIKTKTKIKKSELDIFWFHKTHYKNYSITLSTEKWIELVCFNIEIKNEKGFKINAKLDKENNPVFLEISAPKFKRKPHPVQTSCPDCGVIWFKGDTSSSASHRKIHKRLMNFLNPQPVQLLLNSNINSVGYIVVRADSPKWQHKEMYERAFAFKKEFSYDFIQWEIPKGDSNPNVFGYLFIDVNNAIIGACSFRLRDFDWGLQWIWICPKERRKKHLSHKWKMFKEKFGNFIVEPPISTEMKAFIKAQANQ
jgi:hypothetical protein